jgi:hypothetical protein
MLKQSCKHGYGAAHCWRIVERRGGDKSAIIIKALVWMLRFGYAERSMTE